MHWTKFQTNEKYCARCGKENIIAASMLANRIKTDATIDQIGKVYNFYKRLLKKIL